jgi:hypothetical protein
MMGCRGLLTIIKVLGDGIRQTYSILYTHTSGHPGDIGLAIATFLKAETGDDGCICESSVGQLAAKLIWYLQGQHSISLSVEASDNIHVNYAYEVSTTCDINPVSLTISGPKGEFSGSPAQAFEYCTMYSE